MSLASKHSFSSGLGTIALITAVCLLTLSFLSLTLFNPRFREQLKLPVKIGASLSQDSAVDSLSELGPKFLAQLLPRFSSRERIVFNPSSLPLSSSVTNLDKINKNSSRSSAPLVKVLFSEVLFGQQKNSAYEFIELYNPNSFAVNLKGWEIRKRTESGVESVLVSSRQFQGLIPAQGYFLITHPAIANELQADLVWSGTHYSLAENNSVFLFDAEGRLIDLLGCGNAFAYEGSRCSLPPKNFSVSRLTEIDTDNNQNDFRVSWPTPRNSRQSAGFVSPRLYQITEVSQTTPIPLPSSSSEPSPSVWLSESPSPSPSSSLSPKPSVSVSPLFSPSPSPSPSPLPSFSPSPSPSPAELAPVQIVEVQFGLPENADADFVKFFNPNSVAVDLKPYKLFNKTANGISSNPIKSWGREDEERRVIPPQRYFYWVNSSYQEKITELSSQGFLVFATSGKLTRGVVLKRGDEIVSEVDNL